MPEVKEKTALQAVVFADSLVKNNMFRPVTLEMPKVLPSHESNALLSQHSHSITNSQSNDRASHPGHKHSSTKAETPAAL